MPKFTVTIQETCNYVIEDIEADDEAIAESVALDLFDTNDEKEFFSESEVEVEVVEDQSKSDDEEAVETLMD